MVRNVGNPDRLARVAAAAMMLTCSVLAPFSLEIRVLAMALPALYLLGSALAGSCVGYRLMGRSTCAVARPR